MSMTNNETAERWTKLAERAAKDEKLTAVLESLEENLSPTEPERDRPRLRVPYATAVPISPE